MGAVVVALNAGDRGGAEVDVGAPLIDSEGKTSCWYASGHNVHGRKEVAILEDNGGLHVSRGIR